MRVLIQVRWRFHYKLASHADELSAAGSLSAQPGLFVNALANYPGQ
jgi:hypothetical protein